MSSWLDYADLSDSLSDDESPYCGIYTMKPSIIAANLPRPQTPFIPKDGIPSSQQIFSPCAVIPQNTEPVKFELGLQFSTAYVY